MSYRPNTYIFPGQITPTQHTAQHNQPTLPPWHQQHQQNPLHQMPQQQPPPALYQTQPLAQSLITYGTGLISKTEPISPQAPSSTSKSPVPPVQPKVESMPPTPTDRMSQQSQQMQIGQLQKDEEMFYLAIPKSEMERPEVKSLLGETSPVKDKDNTENKQDEKEPFIPPPVKVKREQTSDVVESVVTDDIEKSVVPTDPSLVPDGEGMVDG